MFPSKYLQPVCDLIWGIIQNLVSLRFSGKNLLEGGQVPLVARDKLSAGVCGGTRETAMFKLLSQGQPGLFICNPVVKELLLEVVELPPEQVLGRFPGGDLVISHDAACLSADLSHAREPGGLESAEQGRGMWYPYSENRTRYLLEYNTIVA